MAGPLPIPVRILIAVALVAFWVWLALYHRPVLRLMIRPWLDPVVVRRVAVFPDGTVIDARVPDDVSELTP